jgi:hypothetical protein
MVGVRLLNAGPKETALVRRQLGPIEKKLDREPDIIVRFVDRLETSSAVHYLGLDDCGFTDTAFLILRAKHKARARVQIPFESIGQRLEIVCERGLPAVPLLIPILNLTVLSKGALPMHASAFSYRNVGILTTGWAKGGKTESLLGFAANGAEYVGDEWVYLSADGESMYGIPEPIRVWNWHLEELPRYRALIGTRDRVRLEALSLLARAMERVVGSRNHPTFVRLLRRFLPILKRQLYVHLAPDQLFGDSARAGTPQKVFWVASHETADITVVPVDPDEIARRMVFSLQDERIDFLSYYLKFRFAFPELRNELIENAEEIQREALSRVLAGKEAYAVHHPYPVSIPALFQAMEPYV